MNFKKCWCLIIGLMIAGNASAVGGRGGLPRLFRVRTDAADVYGWAKESTRDSLRAIVSFGCALGVFKYLRSTKKGWKISGLYGIIRSWHDSVSNIRIDAQIYHKLSCPIVSMGCQKTNE